MKALLIRMIRLAASLAAGVVLCGCAALQVDVDVYKGPLASTDETQQLQLASMALSARPLVLTMRNLLLDDLGILKGTTTVAVPDVERVSSSSFAREVQTKVPLVSQTVTQTASGGSRQSVTRTVVLNLRDNHINTENWDRLTLDAARGLGVQSCDAVKLRNAKQLNGVLSFYDDKPPASVWAGKVDWDPAGWGIARTREGIQTFARRVIDDSHEEKVIDEKAYGRLENMLVDFAGRIQFYATNAWLIDECAQTSEASSYGGGGQGEAVPLGAASSSLRDASKRIKPLLETVANTIFVQADEMRRKSQHQTQQGSYGNLEREAARTAFSAGPHRVYEQMLNELTVLEQEKSAPESSTSSASVQGQNGKGLPAATVSALQRIVTNARVPAENTALLARTLGTVTFKVAPQPGVEAALKAVTVTPVDGSAAWLRDGTAIDSLNAANAPTSLGQLNQSLAKWMGDEIALYSAMAAPRYNRLLAAQQALATLTFTASADAARTVTWRQAMQEVRAAVATKFTDQYRQFQSRNLEFQEAGGPIVVVAGAQPPRSAAPVVAVGNAGITTPQEAQAVRQLVVAARAEALKNLGRGAGNDANAVPTQVRIALETAKAQVPATDAATVAKYDKAIEFARQFRVTVSSVPTLATSTRSATPKPIDVVDSLIAVLRNQHLEAIQRGGKTSADAVRVEEAMAQALEYRKTMVYIRPSSAYLRSASPSTFAQANPRIGWSNMLMDTIKNIARSAGTDPEQGVREELDKAFWQNINTVRVNASGSTNYVLAKDDVGNWYVKAMGADPKAMINAAKNLALFNAGGNLNVNLLRMNQLQTQMDDDKEANDPRRDDWRTELGELKQGSGTFGATNERETTLSLFRRNYDGATRGDGEALRLSLPGTASKIRERWQETLKDDPARLATTLALMNATDLSMTAVTAPLDGSTTAALLPGQIVRTLRNAAAYQSTLASRVRGDASMTLAENSSVTAALGDVKAKAGALANADDRVGELADLITATQSKLVQTPTDATLLQQLDKAKTDYGDAIRQSTDARGALAAAEGTLAARRNALTTARDRQSRAAADVGQVMRPLIAEMATKRLRTVQALESAANVVGRRE